MLEVSLRDTNLVTTSRQCTLPMPTNLCQELFQAAYHLMGDGLVGFEPLRSMGVGVSRLSRSDGNLQLSFLPEDAIRQRQHLLERALDEIRDRYGYFSIRRAVMLTDEALGNINPREEHVLVPEPYFKTTK